MPLLALASFVAFLLAGTPAGRSLTKGAFIYFIIMFPFRRFHLPQEWSPPIVRHEFRFKSAAHTVTADLYRVGQVASTHQKPAVIIYAPLAPKGKRDPHAVNFLKSLARIGFVVLAPEWTERPVGQIDTGDVDDVEASIQYLKKQPDVDPKRIGIVAVSYGVGPSLLAAARAKHRGDLQYIMAIGGYVDLWSVLRFAGNGTVRLEHGEEIHLQPEPYMRYILLQTLAAWTTHVKDTATIRAFLAKVRGYDTPIHLATLRRLLSKESQALLDTLENVNDGMPLKEVRASFPEGFRRNMDALSLTPEMLHKVQARVLIVHTVNDRLVPYSEARALYRHLPKERKPLLSTLSGFDHTIPPPATPANFFFIYAPNALRLVPLLYTFFRMQEE